MTSLWSIGWIRGIDIVFLLGLILGLLGFVVLLFVRRDLLVYAGILIIVWLNFWSLMLIFRCGHFIVRVLAECHLVTENAARMAARFLQGP